MRSNHEALASEDPSAAAALKDAAEQSQQGGIAGQMRDAAGQIGENRMGQAARSQQEVLQKLRDLEDVLRHNRDSDTEMLVKKMKAAEQELSNLRDPPAELAETRTTPVRLPMRRTAGATERHPSGAKARLEGGNGHDGAAFGRDSKLERLKPAPPEPLTGCRMAQTSSTRATGGRRQQQEALDDLDQGAARAGPSPSRRRRDPGPANRSPTSPTIWRACRRVSRRHRRNEAGLDDRCMPSRKWTRAAPASRLPNSSGLSEETGRIAERVAAAEVFALALKGAVRTMGQAADRLAERQTGGGERNGLKGQ